MDDRATPEIGRRDLLRVLTLAGAVAATAMPLKTAFADSFTDEQRTKPRYRDTEDVRNFYRVNQY
jgi:hypothetical protein